MSSSITTDIDDIKAWAERRGAKPASVSGTQHGEEHAGLLRLDFDPLDARLEAISWEDFAEKFDEANLAFLYQDKTSEGHLSRFHKFIDRDQADRR